MPIRNQIFAMAAILTLSACGGGDGNSSAPGAQAFSALCQEQTNMGDAICECVGNKAEQDLNPRQRRFAYASIAGDDETVNTLRGELSVEETMQAGMFFVQAPGACAAGN